MPPNVVTVTLTTPAALAGEVTVILVAEFTVKAVVPVVPNVTAVAPVNHVPVIVTRVPPDVVPFAGEMKLTVGSGMAYVNWLAAEFALVPPGVVTLTSTIPAALAGEVAVILVALTMIKDVAPVVPNVTFVAPINPVPVTVTTVPPVTGPPAGEMPVTVGVV